MMNQLSFFFIINERTYIFLKFILLYEFAIIMAFSCSPCMDYEITKHQNVHEIFLLTLIWIFIPHLRYFHNPNISCISASNVLQFYGDEPCCEHHTLCNIESPTPLAAGYKSSGRLDLLRFRLCFQVFLEGSQKGQFSFPLTPVVSDRITITGKLNTFYIKISIIYLL